MKAPPISDGGSRPMCVDAGLRSSRPVGIPLFLPLWAILVIVGPVAVACTDRTPTQSFASLHVRPLNQCGGPCCDSPDPHCTDMDSRPPIPLTPLPFAAFPLPSSEAGTSDAGRTSGYRETSRSTREPQRAQDSPFRTANRSRSLWTPFTFCGRERRWRRRLSQSECSIATHSIMRSTFRVPVRSR